MKAAIKSMTPLEIINAIEILPEDGKETLSILADKKLSEELLERRKDVVIEMKKGELISEEDILR